MNKEIVTYVLLFYIATNLFMALFNSVEIDCKLRYADYVFPARRLACEVGYEN